MKAAMGCFVKCLVGKSGRFGDAAFVLLFIIVLCLAFAMDAAKAGEGNVVSKEKIVTEQSLLGVWKEKGSNTTYGFMAGHEFELTWWGNIPRKGVWEFREGVCVCGQAKGNLTIYSDTEVCCLVARFLGKNLVLSHIAGPIYRNECKSRILVRQERPKKTK